ncbi:DUF423 domain-containing protein [Acidisoma cellulosilytica]|uniref:DUF423 domain-containing protein n=1 Tax=Acidisoma cellulosilyticum TaxID=2802395 RepID=A0A963Z4G3_9PROT|nr:DUF423 domain-containing protein [Acidisoma cellulosilyticum]MCB8882351.1 DUF423 domain-containing protein [Acidisoma cellulosilyticum]
MDRVWLGAGGLLGLTGVMMAALAAHALPGRITAPDLAFVHTAIEMQMWHALALVGCGILARQTPRSRRILVAGWGFLLGTLLFCGAVYVLALAGTELPAMAPTGGFLTMLGWISLASLAFRRSVKP